MNEFMKLNKIVIWVTVLGLAGLGSYWLWAKTSAPQPGIKVADQGREHVPLDSPFDYNSNPPTSGPHNAEWIKPGIYKEPEHDQKLIHSLEHGYIIISYNCDWPGASSLVKTVWAQEASESAEIDLSKWEQDPRCQDLVSQLETIYREIGLKRIILVARPNLDARIALTAWARIDKFDEVDKGRIERFAKAYHNKGPEQTME